MATKNYNLRTRDMYHPLYSTYQLDYLRPNVWEIVIGASNPVFTNSTAAKNGLSTDRNYTSQSATGNGNRQASTRNYNTEGFNTAGKIDTSASGGLSLYCSKFQLNLPKSHVIDVPWISGVTRLAGRNSEGFNITAEFYAGLGSKSIQNIQGSATGSELGGMAVTDDILRLMYAWRNLCFDARTGQIGLAPSYKKPATLFMYDPSGVQIIYEFTVQGLWPSEIGAIELDVANDDIVKLSVTFQADFVYMEDDEKAMDDFFSPSSETQAGNTTLKMLYDRSTTSTSGTNTTIAQVPEITGETQNAG